MKINTKMLALLGLLVIGSSYGMREDERKEAKQEEKKQTALQNKMTTAETAIRGICGEILTKFNIDPKAITINVRNYKHKSVVMFIEEKTINIDVNIEQSPLISALYEFGYLLKFAAYDTAAIYANILLSLLKEHNGIEIALTYAINIVDRALNEETIHGTLYKTIFKAAANYLKNHGIHVKLALHNNFYPLIVFTVNGKNYHGVSQQAASQKGISTFWRIYRELHPNTQTTVVANATQQEPHSAPACTGSQTQAASQTCSHAASRVQ